MSASDVVKNDSRLVFLHCLLLSWASLASIPSCFASSQPVLHGDVGVGGGGVSSYPPSYQTAHHGGGGGGGGEMSYYPPSSQTAHRSGGGGGGGVGLSSHLFFPSSSRVRRQASAYMPHPLTGRRRWRLVVILSLPLSTGRSVAMRSESVVPPRPSSFMFSRIIIRSACRYQ